MTDSAKQYPLRARRKQKSRSALVAAARQLFTQQGFDATTLEQIADLAGLHVQTLYRHFANKNDLQQAVDQSYLEEFRARFEERSTDTLTCWRDWVEEVGTMVTRDKEVYAQSLTSVHRMRSRGFLQISHEYEKTLASGIAEDLGLDPSESRVPTLLACTLWGGNAYVAREWALQGGEGDLVAECLGVIDDVADLMRLYQSRAAITED